jgi:NAD(P)-dependent dehydrogenase (short-subunit alcohol dehydrogenase family)
MRETVVTASFSGKTALVTGAGRGIGRAVALGLGDAGARLVLIARSGDELAQTRAMLAVRGTRADGVQVISADLGDEEQRGQAAAAALETAPVDILVNNAATVEPLGPTATVSLSEVRRAFEVNVVAVAALTAAVLPGMLAAGWGRIVNVSSAIAARPDSMVRFNTYAATKAALEAHSVNLAAELAGTGVTVNAYRPGGVDTAMQAWIRQQDPERIGAAAHDWFNQNFAEGTLITPEESAAALIAYLSGDETGAIWDVSSAPAVS